MTQNSFSLFLQKLTDRLPSHIVLTDLDARRHYAPDKSPLTPPLPGVVVTPDSEDQIQKLLDLAHRYGIPIVPRGAGTGTTGGALAIENGVVLSFEKLNRILEIDLDNRIAVVEPGVLTGELQRAVEATGLFYPPDPASLAICTLGGNVAENAGGPRGLKYGVTRDYVLGLEGFWADGTPFKLGGKHYKNVAGYDLISLLVGSEGTLGVITKIYLKLLTLPLFKRDMLIGFESVDTAVSWLSSLTHLRILPATAELLDDHCVEAASHYLKIQIPFPRCGAYVLMELDGSHDFSLDQDLDSMHTFSTQAGAVFVQEAYSEPEQAFLWALRQAVSPALKQMAGEKLSHDIVVPPSQMAAYFFELKKLSVATGFMLIGYGHLGDGNIHVNILKLNHSPEAWEAHKHQLSERVLQLAVELGGTLTGEHGIGLTKKNYLSMVFSPQDLAILKGIKQVFDPKGILNPGKMID